MGGGGDFFFSFFWRWVASEQLVAIAAGEWEVPVEQYLNQLQMQFSVQNHDTNFSFVPVSNSIALASLLPCNHKLSNKIHSSFYKFEVHNSRP